MVDVDNLVLETAKSMGFTSKINEDRWQISPINPKETWRLIAAESRWILSIKNVPQLLLNPKEAIAFLKKSSFAKVLSRR